MILKVKKNRMECDISPENLAGRYFASQKPVKPQILGRTSYWIKRTFWTCE